MGVLETNVVAFSESGCTGISTKSSAKGIGESTIRLMTRLCMQHSAVNLSQGYPNEPPPLAVRLALATSVLSGVPFNDTTTNNTGVTEEPMMKKLRSQFEASMSNIHNDAQDVLNQYSPPMGREDLREAIAKHYQTIYNYSVDPETEITVTLGATEAFASALRTIGKPGDKVVIFEPFHELYPSQCGIFYLEPVYVSLIEKNGNWEFDVEKLDEKLSTAKVLVLNTPHNPTGKVFSNEELTNIVALCKRYNVTIITDDIYEHMIYTSRRHLLLPKHFADIKEQVFVFNSVGKSASATGWRVGWCLHPAKYCKEYRGIHDQLVVMAPHPMQYAVITYLALPCSYFFDDLSIRYIDQLKILSDTLREVGFDVPNVEGSYYLFVRYNRVNVLRGKTPWDAALHMITHVGVGCVPGDNFYGTASTTRENYLRFAACRM
mmetsp:Transcript_28209/g.40409  ORF Transcript_28209/g.40409 Transcript_28209/m.40409 type:complete len:434 (-) Transcript_28209:258-1559(-)|eukprot:CAMPEP_0172429780 /NCGR_PEP_ID=MMETSP1064-20121228/51793_1 /TAXON_ID=202472 /ORGANISM="Aulacoseira subarctica , Strain CCAP 1002/5" /LENGTH=433 /DNA_ID=CAMNT_0013175421 /DNA_START=67 /DNA_END=1368 /DNA_ORIENTATION=+